MGCLTVNNAPLKDTIPLDKPDCDKVKLTKKNQLNEKTSDKTDTGTVVKRDTGDNFSKVSPEKNQVDAKPENDSEKLLQQQRHLSTADEKVFDIDADNPVQSRLQSSQTGAAHIKKTGLQLVDREDKKSGIFLKTGNKIIYSVKDDNNFENKKVKKYAKKFPKTENNELNEVFENIRRKKRIQEERDILSGSKNNKNKELENKMDKIVVNNEEGKIDKIDEIEDKNEIKCENKKEKVSFLKLFFEKGKEKENDMSKLPKNKPSRKVIRRKGPSQNISKDQRTIDSFLVRTSTDQEKPDSGKRKCSFIDDNFATGSPSTPKKLHLVGASDSFGVQGELGTSKKENFGPRAQLDMNFDGRRTDRDKLDFLDKKTTKNKKSDKVFK